MNRFFVRALNRLGLVNKVSTASTLTLNNRTYNIPLLKGVGMPNFYISEPWMIDVMKLVLSIENKRFLDIGVNVGQTLLKLKSVSPEIDYIGFEPNPTCVDYVNKLIKRNGIANARLVPVGLADRTMLGELKFYDTKDADDTASILEEFRPEQKVVGRQYIPLFSVDDLKKTLDLSEISVVKIDVEGADWKWLKAFRKNL
ncbi:MAG: FkbM family methyltransferase [Flavobacteriales bacterium]|nr:FkbM family methyltransferase [Flavobacteriales bacterium]